ncbi:hypothetical protein HPB48_020741 [Haemaphysalis longicornis]|uniref:Uncharacterized protein n=1 Tax=Haemaphysalis longicornis TaxID=44386 RepID=A0A9J6G0A8_HAELO|nr:hypothetical protein HPB48_020741 [Haemaphysalis longicornis]
MVHLPHRAGGLGALELARVVAEYQLKAFARLQRLHSPAVDTVLRGPLEECRVALGESLGLPTRRGSLRLSVVHGRHIRDNGRPGIRTPISLPSKGTIWVTGGFGQWCATWAMEI